MTGSVLVPAYFLYLAGGRRVNEGRVDTSTLPAIQGRECFLKRREIQIQWQGAAGGSLFPCFRIYTPVRL